MHSLLDDVRQESRAPPPEISPERDYISFSAIKTYQQCPLRYFFRYIAGLPEQTVAASLVFGSAIHRGLEFYFRQLLEVGTAPALPEMLAEYRLGWGERDLPIRFNKGEQISLFAPLAERMLTAFLQSDLAQPGGRILAVEETLRGEVIPGLPELLGRVDLILETPDELVIRDWKTSRSRYTQDQVDESAAQLLLYGELAQSFAPGKSVRLEFAVLTKTKEVNIDQHIFLLEQQPLDRTKRIVERVWQAIQDQHFYPAPSLMNCAGCPYKSPCQHWPG
jgi:putative RecB family exonuclease